MARRKIVVMSEGRRYRLGRTDEYGGIWRKRPWGWRLVSRYPLTEDAWRVAQVQFATWEQPVIPSDPTAGRPGTTRWLVGGAAAVAIAIAIVVALVLSSSSRSPRTSNASEGSVPQSAAPGSGYLATGPSYVLFMQWNDSAGAISGTLQAVTTSGSPPDERSSSDTANINGTLRGGTISISFNGSPASFGTVSNGSFTLSVPQSSGTLEPITFHRASAQDFNNAVATLTSNVDTTNNQAAAAKAQADAEAAALRAKEDAITKSAAQAASDISQLSGADFASELTSQNQSAQQVGGDLKQIRADYAQFQNDLANNNQYGQACTDVGGSLDAELEGSLYGQIGGVFVIDVNDLQGGLDGLRQIIQKAPGDVAALQSAQFALPAYQAETPVGDPQTALHAASSAISHALAQGNGVTDQVNSNAQQAYQLVSQANRQASCGLSVQAPSVVAHIK